MNRTLLALLIVVVYVLFSLWCLRRGRRAVIASDQPADVLVAFASQTGNAQQLAQQTADSISAGGLKVTLVSMNEVTLDKLLAHRRALFVVSTTGEGDAPDTAVDFVRHAMADAASLQTLEYGLLALGDRRYAYFCGFGHRLDTWLQHAHALPLFDIVEVDNSEAGALRHWQSQLSLLTGASDTADWVAPDYQSWRLAGRQLLNPGSAGGAVYHLRLEGPQPNMQWMAGDIVEIGPRNAPADVIAFMQAMGLRPTQAADDLGTPWPLWLADKLIPQPAQSSTQYHAELSKLAALPRADWQMRLKPLAHREYSIASLPHEGLELVVRQVHNTDGTLGHGSGWLTQHAQIGGDIALRIRANPMFHPPEHALPLILIGNGTGIAGLRAHLKASIQAGQHRHWLLFGERHAAYDHYFMDELSSMQQQGNLTRLDIAYSRDQAKAIYVQDLLDRHASTLKQWVDEGAAILVCGSASGMAPAVHHQLGTIVGEAQLSQLAAAGRYRRDIY